MNEEILKEILKEMAKPPKHEVGFVEARRTINDGLVILGMTATDILGFAKEANETRARRSRGSQAWFKKMYEDGWRYAGNFEYEGLLHAGFIIMERELPNKRLEQLIESLSKEDKDPFQIDTPILGIDKGPELPGRITLKDGVVQPKEKTELEIIKKKAEKFDSLKEYYTPKVPPIKIPYKLIEKVKEPKEGFEPDIDALIGESQKGMKSLEELFFDETGRNAIWRGNETKGFKNWKENRD